MVARKTQRLVEQLQRATWKPSPKADADEQCEFFYQPDGWSKAHRFLALRYVREEEDEKPEHYQLFDSPLWWPSSFMQRQPIGMNPTSEPPEKRFARSR
ncbi:MAG TPA: hypothetical protein VI320_31105 [Terracidiphilus sp.]